MHAISLLSLFVLLTLANGCGGYQHAIDSGKKQDPIASLYSHFPEADSSISHFLAKDEGTNWTTRVPFSKRYVLVVRAHPVFGNGNTITAFQEIRAQLFEVTRVTTDASGVRAIMYGYQWTLTDEQLKQLSKDGDFDKLGLPLKKEPVEHFDEAWRSV